MAMSVIGSPDADSDGNVDHYGAGPIEGVCSVSSHKCVCMQECACKSMCVCVCTLMYETLVCVIVCVHVCTYV